MEHPKIFVSYSQDNKNLKNWALKLSTDLRTHGVDVILDQWDLRLGQDLRFFMEQGLSSSQKILCICSSNYTKKVNEGVNGAGFEGMIMTRSLLENCNQDYIIPIIRDNPNGKIPRVFGSKYYIDFSNDANYYDKYRQLLENIYEQDKSRKPRLGHSPFDRELSNSISEKLELDKIKYLSPKMDGKVSFNYDNHNSIYYLGSGDYLFKTRWSECTINAIYACGNIGYMKKESEFPKLDNIKNFDFSSNTRSIYKGEVVLFQNDNYHFVAIKVKRVSSISHGDDNNILEFEYHIYS